MKILLTKKGKRYYVRDLSKDFHTAEGFVKAEDLKKEGKVMTSKGGEMFLLEAGFIDLMKRIKRGPQIITAKDVGQIIVETGVGKDSKVVDIGGGSGALACALARVCKEVVTYEVRKDFVEIIKWNKKHLGLKNLKVKCKDVNLGMKEKGIDLVTIDLPEPWGVLDKVKGCLKRGGFLVGYVPNIYQVEKLVRELRKREELVYLKTMELIKREWRIEEKVSRPEYQMLGHTGFLVFGRKV